MSCLRGMAWLLWLLLLLGPALAQEVEPHHDDPIGELPSTAQPEEPHEQRVVPKLLLFEQAEVERRLRALGLQQLRIVKVPSQTRSGVVLYLVPPPGKSVNLDERVTVFVSEYRAPKEKHRTPPPRSGGAAPLESFLGIPLWLLAQLLLLVLWIRLSGRLQEAREEDTLTLLYVKHDRPATTQKRPGHD